MKTFCGKFVTVKNGNSDNNGIIIQKDFKGDVSQIFIIIEWIMIFYIGLKYIIN